MTPSPRRVLASSVLGIALLTAWPATASAQTPPPPPSPPVTVAPVPATPGPAVAPTAVPAVPAAPAEGGQVAVVPRGGADTGGGALATAGPDPALLGGALLLGLVGAGAAGVARTRRGRG
ncbi:Tat pathway signal sequence domain protein [Pseudonocardia broussonetiae]|uniref:Tat pathway signal sequence domain protein n=1 Tax=Pseudonocardia broussonetiae TaxID=2736640 RepID=A0A6M6JK81_9PSEU|nr:Tat pathway signal sequence domain protein [Pseudonocardia broussonetiae]QJY46741.1 Tat pathway signal sequence domain protein [Pseudonocardia broussonetiae]